MERDAQEDRGYAHIPVMLDEVLALAPAGPAPWILDATFGRGGHSRALLARLGPEARLFALDRDPEALAAAQALAAEDPRVTVVPSAFGALAEALAPHLQGRGLDGVLMDLGVSSPQLDDPARGFSFRNDGPLDMRMSGEGRSAAEVLAECEEGELARIFKELGEERFARRIARALSRRGNRGWSSRERGSWRRRWRKPILPGPRIAIRRPGCSWRFAFTLMMSSVSSKPGYAVPLSF